MILLFKHKYGTDFFLLSADGNLLYHCFEQTVKLKSVYALAKPIEVAGYFEGLDELYDNDYTVFGYDMAVNTVKEKPVPVGKSAPEKPKKAPAKKAPAKKAK